MNPAPDITAESVRLDALYRAKARAEIDAAERTGAGGTSVRPSGDELAEIVLVKGEPGPGDLEGGYALAGADGEAADKALDALGAPAGRFAFCTRVAGVDGEARSHRIRMLLEAVDPSVVLALDMLAASDLEKALGIGPIVAGTPLGWRGRTVLAVEGLEASLSDEGLKRCVWRQLKALAVVEDA